MLKPSEQAVKLAWTIGSLGYKYRPIQHKFGRAWEEARKVSKKFVLRATRRGTKSTWLLLTDFETCIREPGSYLAFVAPVKQGLEEYINQVASTLLADCPQDLRPVWRSKFSQWYFPLHDSTISCAGSNSQSYNNLRGKKFKRASVDEAAFVDDLDELVEGVLIPSIFDSNGFLRLSSSAPELPDHPFDRYYEEAVQGGYAAQFTIHEAGYPPELIETWAKEYGGKESARFKREFLCESVIDPERRIIPEWRHDYVVAPARDEFFPFYHKYNALDTGVRDFTVNLFFHYDFRRAKWIFEDEVLLKGEEVRTDTLAAQIKQKEKELGYAKTYRRIGDNNNLIILQDLSGIHGLPFIPTTKDDLFAMVNEVRLMVNAGRVLVNPRCKHLIGCLERGIWSENRKEFSRSAALGHFDGLAALCYAIRNTDTNTNPIPALHGLSIHTHHIDPTKTESDTHKALRQALKMPLPRKTTDDWRKPAWK